MTTPHGRGAALTKGTPMNDLHAAIDQINDRRALAGRVRLETEDMLCDTPMCRSFATYAIVGDDARADADELLVDLACDAHHDEHARGFHVAIEPLSPDVEAMHAWLAERRAARRRF